MSVVVKDDRCLGHTIGGEYRIRSLLGQGGLGSVYLADQIGVGRTVVVKVIQRALTGEEATVRRFEREARIVARLDHPNIVSLLNAGETKNGAHYVVTEYAAGPTLQEEIHRAGKLDETRAARIGAQIAGALSAAHAAGVVHRDLKPANVILTTLPDGEDHVQVLDFGLAPLSEQDAGSALAATGAILGTPTYMSPEQVGGGEIDGRADLFTLGVMLYEMVTGKPPYDADTPGHYVLQYLQEPMMPPRVQSPGLQLSDGFLAVLNRACAKDPTDRFASAEAMQNSLRRAAERVAQLGDSSTLPVVPAPTNTWAEAAPNLTSTEPVETPRLRPLSSPSAARVVLLGVAAMLLVIVAATFLLLAPVAEPEGAKPWLSQAVAQVVPAPEVVPEAMPSRLQPSARPGTGAETVQPRPVTPPLAAVPNAISPSGPKNPASSPANSAPPVSPISRPAQVPTLQTAPSAEEFRFALHEERGFPLPARSRVRRDTSGSRGTATPWDLEAIVKFLREEFGGISMVNDHLDELEPWLFLVLDDGPLNMVRADPEGRGTRFNYFLNQTTNVRCISLS